MGGCRCSYKSCKVRSDGKTHMFHFPVFDKLRCHQWITNAMKPNFLNLRLSQIKNRVVCQHHFIDDWFMNFTKSKLKPKAVPTEDGPFCGTTENIEPVEEHDKPTIAINIDDIEDEVLNHIDKRAHTSVKYGDFLISDVTELLNTSHNKIDSPLKDQSKDPVKINNVFSLRNEDNNYTINYSNDMSNPMNSLYIAMPKNAQHTTKLSTPKLINHKIDGMKCRNIGFYGELPPKQHNLSNTIKTPNIDLISEKKDAVNTKIVNINEEVSSPSNNTNLLYSNAVQNPTVVSIEFDETVSKQTSDNAPVPESQEANHSVHGPIMVRQINPDKIVKIISEKTFSEPLKLEGKLEPVSPSTIIRVPRRSQRGKLIDWIVKPELKTEENFNELRTSTIDSNLEQIVPIEYMPNENVLYFDHNNPMNEQENIQKVTENKNIEPDNLITLNELLFENEKNKLQPIEQDYLQDKEPIKEYLIKPQNQTDSNRYNTRSLVKKLPPERLAAIEKKRNYNKKLRDVITSCIGNSNRTDVLDKSILKDMKDTISTMPSKEPPVSNTKQDTTIAYLEARFQRMEDTLLNKIDHNTTRINELKRTIKPTTGKKNANTQTYETEQAYKQYLYKEISKYLSSNANTTIYGELFLNTRNDFETPLSPSKKRRRRR